MSDELKYQEMTNEELYRLGFGDADDAKAREEYGRRVRLLRVKEELARERESK